jgi:hypothetical protein
VKDSAIRHVLILHHDTIFGTIYALDGAVLKVGTDPASDVIVDIPENVDFQFVLTWDEDGYAVRVYRSNIAMLLNGTAIQAGQRLKLGDLFELGGKYRLEYNTEDSDEAEEIVLEINSSNIGVSQGSELSLAPQNQLVTYQQITRIGCTYCFSTLNPDDPDVALRDFVQYQDKYYHLICLQAMAQNNLDVLTAAIKATIAEPTPLTDERRTAVVLHGGPINSLDDVPLGVSVGTVVFDVPQQEKYQTFIVQNNTEQVIHIPRHIQPNWVFIDFGAYQDMSPNLILKPYQRQQVKVYPYVLRPPFVQKMVELLNNQAVLIISERASFPLAVNVFSLGFAIGIHWLAFSRWIWRPAFMLEISLTSGLLVAWFAFMMPASMLWSAFRFLERLKELPLLKSIPFAKARLRDGQKLIWEQFNSYQISALIQNPGRLLAIALATGVGAVALSLVVWLLFRIPLGIVYGILGGLGLLLIEVGYAVLLFLLAAWVVADYGINLPVVTQKAAIKAMKQAQSMSKSGTNSTKTDA